MTCRKRGCVGLRERGRGGDESWGRGSEPETTPMYRRNAAVRAIILMPKRARNSSSDRVPIFTLDFFMIAELGIQKRSDIVNLNILLTEKLSINKKMTGSKLSRTKTIGDFQSA